MEESAKGNKSYTSWSQEQLIQRVTQLENELRAKTISIPPPPTQKEKFVKRPKVRKAFDPSKYSTRLVAFKLAYLGKRYNGFEYHSGQQTPLPTIEEELWKALTKAKLISPTGNQQVGDWEGCEYSKCGRTDRGVSAFGQVIGVRLRSNRPLIKQRDVIKGSKIRNEEASIDILQSENGLEQASPPLAPSLIDLETQASESIQLSDSTLQETLDFDPILDEIPYPSLLNKLLPPDIRILAWCPNPPLDFSARFSCRERQYRYFFTQPCFLPLPHHLDPFHAEKSPSRIKDGWLDISAMKEAAKLFEGLHDFRNFCKVDPSKQIENFERRVFKADIEEVPDSTPNLGFLNGEHFTVGEKKDAPKIYTFTLHGSAFLWHQVRHMVAILFLVGQGLEPPSLVTELLDVKTNPRRPIYEMATDTPLVLWDCIFPREGDEERKDALEWCYIGDFPGQAEGKYGVPAGGVMDDLWRVWRERKVDEVLAGSLLGMVAAQGKEVQELSLKGGKGGWNRGVGTLLGVAAQGKDKEVKVRENKAGKSQRVFDGDDDPRLKGTYEKVMSKERMETVEVINEKYAVRKGFESAEEMKKLGFRRLNKVVDDE